MAAATAARQALSQARRIAKSDPRVYEGLCAFLAREYHHSVWSLGAAPEDLFNDAAGACREGLLADPERAGLLCELADLLDDRAEHLFIRGEEVHEAMAAGLEALQRASGLDPASARMANVLPSHHW